MGAERLQVLVFGAGAIGTYIGGSLALQGHPATFVERPDVAEFVRQNGMCITQEGTTSTIPRERYAVVPSLDEAAARGPFDVALFALKSFDTPAFAAELAATLGKQASDPAGHTIDHLLCLSNGVDNEAILAEALGAGRVIAGTVTTAIGRRAAGDIVVEKLRGLGVAAGGPLSGRLAAAMAQAGLNARLYARAADMKWSKMLTNLLANATSAILNMTPAEVFADPRLCHLEMLQLREALAVMAKLDIRPVDLPRTPVALLALGVRLPVRLARPFLAKAVGGGRGAKMPSFHIDLYAGRTESEVEYLNGAVVRYGEKVGVPTPVNRLLTETLCALARKTIPLDTYDHRPEKLLGALHEKS
ncbi:MAG: ketopantoate reductase family protein [Chloroflexota bacterium]